MNPMVEIKGISKSFGKTIALSEIDLTIAEGQFFALVGPSGSGKTTLLHILGGFIEPSAGRVHNCRSGCLFPAAGQTSDDIHVPGLCFISAHVGGSQCRFRPVDEKNTQIRKVGPGRKSPGHGGPVRDERQTDPSALRRPAATRGPGPRPGG